ncbi:MAG: YdbL family protein [Desulfuromonadaceae bacterium]|nr:YdbL family protein [Desulfuromonadaceae bacterium]
MKRNVTRLLLPTLAVMGVLLLCCASAFAIDLESAKASGLVGETPSGYLAPVQAPTPQVEKLIEAINGKRKASYEKIAVQNGTTLQVVEKMAGQKSMQKTAAGQYILVGGAWQKK